MVKNTVAVTVRGKIREMMITLTDIQSVKSMNITAWTVPLLQYERVHLLYYPIGRLPQFPVIVILVDYPLIFTEATSQRPPDARS